MHRGTTHDTIRHDTWTWTRTRAKEVSISVGGSHSLLLTTITNNELHSVNWLIVHSVLRPAHCISDPLPAIRLPLVTCTPSSLSHPDCATLHPSTKTKLSIHPPPLPQQAFQSIQLTLLQHSGSLPRRSSPPQKALPLTSHTSPCQIQQTSPSPVT